MAVQSLLRSGVIQAKLTISQPGDPHEAEADRVADAVMSTPAANVSTLGVSPAFGIATGSLQRKCACGDRPGAQGECEACRDEQINLQRRPANGKATAAPAVHAALRSGGHPLDSGNRAFFESRFGRDFSQVRIHSGTEAAASARAVNALAYTVGRDIVFAPGQYDSGSNAGRHLLAHELTHVAQQEAGGSATLQRQEDPEPVGLPPEHPGNLAAIEESEESLKPQREERANTQRELAETQMSNSDPKQEEAMRAREKEVSDRLSQVEKNLAAGLQQKIGLIDRAISQIEQVLPGHSGGGAPEVKQEVWDELDRLRSMKKAAEKELLPFLRAQKRELIKQLNEAIKKLPEGSPERMAMEKDRKEAAEFLSGTAENRAAPGTRGPRAGESGPPYVVYSGYVKVGGNTPWRNNNPGNVQRSPSGADPPGVLGVDKWQHYIFESYDVGQMAIYFDLVNRRGGAGANLRAVLRSYIAGGKKDEELPEKCGPGDDLAVCVTRESAQSYPGKVAGTAGLTDKLDQPIGSLNDAEKKRLVDAIKKWEGGTIVTGDTYTCADAAAPLYRNLLGCDE